MPSMNTGMQRRIGVLPKTEDLLEYQGHIFGNTHRGFGARTPTPTQDGFWGIGGLGMTEGDGMANAWYGNDALAQGPLPAAGVYGIGSAEAEAMTAASHMGNEPANWDAPGIFGIGDTMNNLSSTQKIIAGIFVIGAGAYVLR